MSKTTISIVVVVAVAGVVGGLWWVGALNGLSSKLNLDLLLHENGVAQEEAQPQQTKPQSELATGSNNSNEALEQDLSTLDAQLNAYNESSSNVDASLNDQPVEQDSTF